MTYIWNAARVALAGVVLAFGGTAQAHVVYDLGYDPVGFFGNGQISIDDDLCLSTDGPHASSDGHCQIDLVFVNAHDSGGGNWLRGPLLDIAEGMTFDVVNHEIVSFGSIPITLFFDHFDSDRLTGIQSVNFGCEASGQLQFFRGDNQVTFQGCDGNEQGTYHLTRVVPEPASAALVLGALGAAWLGRRRRRRD
jgi:hypothetical protein